MKDWHHSPVHRIIDKGTFIVTASTYCKEELLKTDQHKILFQDTLHELSEEFHWNLQAWAILNNHYHFIVSGSETSDSLRKMIHHLHSITAVGFNKLDRLSGRRVWFQYWDSAITYQNSYLARLNYVHQNPVHHGIVKNAVEYPFCSALWFENHAEKSFQNTVSGFKIDRVNVIDDF
jgi:putative transposase